MGRLYYFYHTDENESLNSVLFASLLLGSIWVVSQILGGPFGWYNCLEAVTMIKNLEVLILFINIHISDQVIFFFNQFPVVSFPLPSPHFPSWLGRVYDSLLLTFFVTFHGKWDWTHLGGFFRPRLCTLMLAESLWP